MSDTVARARMFGFHGDWVALERHHYEKHPEGDVVFYEVAEKLERERDEARRELAELKTELARVSQMDQHADKSSVGDSTYVLTQQPCQRVSRVGMETDWTAIGYREGMSAALHSGGIRGAKWHAERKGIQGEAADNYISGFNAALDEYEQEKA